MGVMTVTGWMNGVTSYLSSFGAAPAAQEQPADQGAADAENGGGPDGGGPSDGASGSDRPSGGGSADAGAASKDGMRMAPNADLVLVDQDGTEHRLSDYRGKTVFLNFFATWCGPCQREIPDIEALYRDRGENASEVVVLGVANPKTSEHPQNSDVGVDEVEAFIDEYGITYPVLMDTTGQLFSSFGVSSFPTTFMIDKDGYVFGYAAGMLTADVMDNIVDQTISGVRK